MALPVILVNSATGSDTAASGAGPSTAKTGSAGVSAVDGLSVLLDGSPDLSGVPTDGSAVLYYADATAGNQNFGKITGTSGSGGPTATVTVATAFGLSLTKAWAIGGVRASIGSTTSIKLFSNNSAAGDARAGWAVEMQSGHTETIAATYVMRRAGDPTIGNIELRGTAAAATPPIITFSNNGVGFSTIVDYRALRDFDIQNSHVTKTASVAVETTSAVNTTTIDGIRVNDATNKFWKGMTSAAGACLMSNCNIANTAAQAIQATAGYGVIIRNCRIKAAGATAGIDLASSSVNPTMIVEDSIITGCTGQGILLSYTSTAIAFSTFGARIQRCTIDSNTADGVRWAGSTTQIAGYLHSRVENCNITANGGWGVNFSNGSPPSVGVLTCLDYKTRTCNFGTGATANTSGTVSVSGTETGTIGVDPGYVATGSDNYAVGASVAALGYPGVVGQSGTTSYMDIGAAQRVGGGPVASASAG